jgi:hypothetical protein
MAIAAFARRVEQEVFRGGGDHVTGEHGVVVGDDRDAQRRVDLPRDVGQVAHG